MVRNSVLNFKYKPLNGMHDFPCSTFKVLQAIIGGHVAWGMTEA